MKRLIFSVFLGLALATAFAGDAPRGSLLELHSCELYAGGCTVSSEMPQDGRYMLSVWNFTGGTFGETELNGLQLALVQTSPDNLASRETKSADAVAYLPESATQAQRDALFAWLKSSQPGLKAAHIQTRTVPLKFVKDEKGYGFSAGQFISVRAASLESCEIGSCGEELWYQPRAATTLFTVAANRASLVSEPLLKLMWTDSGKRSVFLARFGEATPSKDVYVTLGELCGAKGLF